MTANAGPDQTANEGSTVSFSGSAGGGTGTLSYDWDFGDGSAHGTGALTPTHKYGDDGAYTVTLTVTDATNATATDTAVVTVANVAPTGTLSNSGPVAPNATVTISFANQFDPGTVDTAAGFKYSYDFDNNGTWEVTDSTTASATTSYATAGTKTVKARIKDSDGGFTDYTTTVTVNSGVTPAAPSNLAATVVSQSEVNLTWDLGDATDTAVVIERKTGSGGTYQTLAVLPGGENIYTDTSGWADQTYFYHVKARNSGGDSGYSAALSATTQAVPAGALAVVSNLKAVANSPTTATITFTNTNASSGPMYLLERSADGMAYQVISSLGTATSYSDVGLTPGATYSYRVRGASWSKPTSDYTSPVSVTLSALAAGAPIAPSGLQATDQSATSVLLTWTNNDPASLQYKVERAAFNAFGSQTWTQVAVTAAGAMSYTDTGLSAEHPYAYRVRATNAQGNSAYATPASDVMHSMFGDYVAVATASAGTGTAKTYDIGPGQTYTSIGALNWSLLGPGDTVNIHYKAGGYHEIFQVATRGTPANWITINGVPDPSTGALPVIDGANAVLASQFQNHYAPLSGYGALVIGTRPGYLAGYKPGYIQIQNLQVQGAYSANRFTDFDGSTKTYGNVGAGIYLERADHITLKGDVVTNNGEGVFGAGQSGFDRLMTDVTLDSNYIYGNGNVGSDREHNTYLEGIDTVYQFNRYGPLRNGAGGAGLKDRSVGTVIRYNSIQGGAHQLQLPEAQNQIDLAITLPRYHQMWVYGNTLVAEAGNPNSPVWFGGDQGLDPFYRKGVLYFYNNTVVVQSTQAQVYHMNAIQLSSSGETLDARNNIFTALPTTAGATPTAFGLISGNGIAYFGRNWVSPGYQMTIDNAGFTGHAGGTANLIVGSTNNPGFVNATGGDFHLATGSAAIDAASRLSGTMVPFSVEFEYIDPHTGRSRSVVGSAVDLGAFEFGN